MDILIKKNGNEYLTFDDSVNENQGLLRIYADVWDGIKNEIKAINGGEENNYGKDYMNIKFNSDDDLPFNKQLKFHAITRIISSVFEEGGKLYPQHFVWIIKMLQYEKLLQVHQKYLCFVVIDILKMLDLNLNRMFVTNVRMCWQLLMS